MQGVHAFEPKATVSIDLESFVATGPSLATVDRVLDTVVCPGVDGSSVCSRSRAGLRSIRKSTSACNWWPTFSASLRSGNSAKTSTTISLTAGSAACRSRKKCRTIHRSQDPRPLWRRDLRVGIPPDCRAMPAEGLGPRRMSSDDRCDVDRCRCLAELAGASTIRAKPRRKQRLNGSREG